MKLEDVVNETFIENDIRQYYAGKIIEKKDCIDDLKEKEIYEILVLIATLYENYESLIDVFTSSNVFNNIDESKIDLIKDLDINAFPIVLGARVYDFLWETIGNDVDFANNAVEKYLKLFELVYNSENWVLCFQYIFRATVIAAQIGKAGILYQNCINTILNKLNELDGNDKNLLSIKLIELLKIQQYKDEITLMNFLEKIIQNSKKVNNIIKIEEAYKLKLKIEKNQNNKKIIKLEIAEFYEQFADNYDEFSFQNISEKVRYLEKSIHSYNEAGEKEKSKNAMRKLEETRKNIKKFFVEKEVGKINITDLCNKIRDSIKELNTKELIEELALSTKFYRKDDIEKEVINDTLKYIGNTLFETKIVDEEGKTILILSPLDINNVQDNKMLLELYMHRKLREKEEIEGAVVLSLILDRIKDNYIVKKEDIFFLIEDNCIIPQDREEIFIEGILKGLNGDYYTALHILAPQMENLFRTIAKELGGITFTLENDNTSKVKVLSSVFEIEELNDGYNEDILFIFKGLLNEQAGANIRNDIGHGILSEKVADSGIGKYFLSAVIKLLYMTSKNSKVK